MPIKRKKRIDPRSAILSKGFGQSILENLREASRPTRSVVEIELSQLELDPNQPRKYFDEASLQSLAETIKAHGVLQPILVTPTPGGGYRVVFGARRFLASKMAGCKTIPAVIREDLVAEQIAAVQLLENLQRADLTDFEETEGILSLLHSILRHEAEFAEFERGGDGHPVVKLLTRLQNERDGRVKDAGKFKVCQELVEKTFEELGGKMSWLYFLKKRVPLLRQPPDILEALRRGEIDYTKALQVAKLSSARLAVSDSKAREIRRSLIERIKSEDLSFSQVAAAVRREIERKSNAGKHNGSETVSESSAAILKRVAAINEAIKNRKLERFPDARQKQLLHLLDQVIAFLRQDKKGG